MRANHVLQRPRQQSCLDLHEWQVHLGLSSTLKSAKEQMEAAAKAAREAAKKPTNAKSHSGSSKTATPGPEKVQTEAGTKEASDDPASTPELTRPSTAECGPGASTGSLFDLEAKNDE